VGVIFAGTVPITTEFAATTSAYARLSLSFFSSPGDKTDPIVCRCSVDEGCQTRTTLQHLALHERECRNIRNQLRDAHRKISALEESSSRSAAIEDDTTRKRKRDGGTDLEARKKVKELERDVASLMVENSRLKSRLISQPSNPASAFDPRPDWRDFYSNNLNNRQSR